MTQVSTKQAILASRRSKHATTKSVAIYDQYFKITHKLSQLSVHDCVSYNHLQSARSRADTRRNQIASDRQSLRLYYNDQKNSHWFFPLSNQWVQWSRMCWGGTGTTFICHRFPKIHQIASNPPPIDISLARRQIHAYCH
jgi:hypothetical protein